MSSDRSAARSTAAAGIRSSSAAAPSRRDGPGTVSRWLPVAAWAGLIWWFSTAAFSGDHTRGVLLPLLRLVLPGAAPETLQVVHDVVRKLAHPMEYAVLAILVYRALHQRGRGRVRTAALSLALCAGWAGLDEFHQAFVPSRGGSPVDVALDTAGAAGGLALREVAGRWRRRRISAGRRSRA